MLHGYAWHERVTLYLCCVKRDGTIHYSRPDGLLINDFCAVTETARTSAPLLQCILHAARDAGLLRIIVLWERDVVFRCANQPQLAQLCHRNANGCLLYCHRAPSILLALYTPSQRNALPLLPSAS